MSMKIKEVFLLITIVYALQNTYEACVDTDKLAAVNKALVRQVRMQQMALEENVRLEGNSGVKRIRQFRDGTKPYHVASMSSYKMLALHNHANHIRTVGLGELSAVLNGVQFRTRHNDYSMVSPSLTSREYGATDEIPFPAVPPEVLSKPTLAEQVEEMKEYFKAFKNNQDKHRNFRPYFKPILCYLEGAWTLPEKDIEEPFASDRHFVEALTWNELHDKVEFTSYTGHKNERENYAYLPTKILGLTNDSMPIVAQWNYRVLCHTLKWDVLTDRMKPIDDFHLRLQNEWTKETHEMSNAARFELNVENSNKWYDGHHTFRLLDRLMEQIPGLDNYRQRFQIDHTFGLSARHPTTGQLLSAGYYHRWYKVDTKGAMGTNVRHRGYNDKHIFMAMTTQSKVAPMSMVDKCRRSHGQIKCDYQTTQRWSYAIPLEIIYLTPLHTWNPHNIKYRGSWSTEDGAKVAANGRNGGFTTTTAFDGINDITFYRTPAEMFSSGEVNQDAADTVKNTVGVLDGSGNVVKVVATGVRSFFPNISGVGIVRQRYPIAPIADDGATVWKELESIKEYLFNPLNHPKIQKELEDENKVDPATAGLTAGEYQMSYALQDLEKKIGYHTHTIRLTSTDINMLVQQGIRITVTTSVNDGHMHTLRLGVRTVNGQKQLIFVSCDGISYCQDGHDHPFTRSDY